MYWFMYELFLLFVWYYCLCWCVELYYISRFWGRFYSSGGDWRFNRRSYRRVARWVLSGFLWWWIDWVFFFWMCNRCNWCCCWSVKVWFYLCWFFDGDKYVSYECDLRYLVRVYVYCYGFRWEWFIDVYGNYVINVFVVWFNDLFIYWCVIMVRCIM